MSANSQHRHAGPPALPVRARRGRCARSATAIIGIAVISVGCAGKPDAANIELRKNNQSLHDQLDKARQQHSADTAQMNAIRASAPTVPTLPPERLARLDTVTAIRIGRLTGGYSTDRQGDVGAKIYFVPVDASGQSLKATGSVVIDVFDLGASDKQPVRVAHGNYDLDEARKAWRGEFLMDYYYVFNLPWSTTPTRSDLTVRVQFTDELTQLPFVQQQQIHIDLPKAAASPSATTQPASN